RSLDDSELAANLSWSIRLGVEGIVVRRPAAEEDQDGAPRLRGCGRHRSLTKIVGQGKAQPAQDADVQKTSPVHGTLPWVSRDASLRAERGEAAALRSKTRVAAKQSNHFATRPGRTPSCGPVPCKRRNRCTRTASPAGT